MSSRALSSDDTATVIAAGALAATAATVCHETLGHGLGCLSAGGHITLLTSTWFHCSKGSALADVGGPIGNAVAGCLALALLRYTRPGPTVRLFLLLWGALSGFWFTAQLVFESVSHRPDDWYRALQLGSSAASRPIAAVVGILGYVIVGRVVAAINRKPGGGSTARAIRLAYAASAISGVIAGWMWRPEPLRSAFEGLIIIGIAPLGLLNVARQASREVANDRTAGSVPRSWLWIGASAVLFGLFLCTQARGLGF